MIYCMYTDSLLLPFLLCICFLLLILEKSKVLQSRTKTTTERYFGLVRQKWNSLHLIPNATISTAYNWPTDPYSNAWW